MTKGGSYLTQEQREFLDGCEFKVYLIYANGRAGVETIYGLDGFVNCIKKGVFTKDNPGGPLFCTFNNVKDNSPVKVRFKYNIRREPLYVEMKKVDKDLNLFFYKNMNRVPTIANPKIKFELETKRKTHVYPGGPSGLESGITFSTEYLQNAGYETSIIAKQNPVFFYRKKVCHPGGREIVCTELYDMDYTYTLLPGEGYEVIGQSSFSN